MISAVGIAGAVTVGRGADTVGGDVAGVPACTGESKSDQVLDGGRLETEERVGLAGADIGEAGGEFSETAVAELAKRPPMRGCFVRATM